MTLPILRGPGAPPPLQNTSPKPASAPATAGSTVKSTSDTNTKDPVAKAH
jgi:hypothetical protein